MSKAKLYLFLSVACTVGYTWLFFCLSINTNSQLRLCLFKQITTFPCPSCGVTRSVILLLGGNITGSFFCNPLGFIVGPLLLACPFWIVYDLLYKKQTLYTFYSSTETFIQKRAVAVCCISIVLLNWIWNIYKDL